MPEDVRIAPELASRGAANLTEITVGVEEAPGQSGWYTMLLPAETGVIESAPPVDSETKNSMMYPAGATPNRRASKREQ